MDSTLQLFMIGAEVIYFLLIIVFLKKKTLSLKYTFFWLIAGVFMFVFTLCPDLLKVIMDIFNIQSMMNGLFAICIFFIIIILMSLTSICSKQSERIRSLVQENAILDKKVRDLSDKINEN